MVAPGLGSALDTPRTALGDATYLDQQPDFADISQEATFISPSKDSNNNHLLQQMRNGGRTSLRTPRQREPFADRRNLPQSIGGAEFTPLLKSATRNSVKRGKPNGKAIPATPALNRIEEDDMTPLPQNDASMYTGSRSQSYLDNTLPQVDSSSPASTPLAMLPRRDADKGPLQDGNGLSLREQENVVNRMEKENFGLKLKIHFLEEALRKAGPGFSEAALKENTELKVDKVTMQRELHRYKKHLTGAEKDLETYRQQLEELQARAMRKGSDQGLEEARRKTEQLVSQHEEEVQDLKRQIEEAGATDDLEAQLEQLRDQKAAIEEELEEARYEHRQEIDQLETEHEKEIARLKRDAEETGQSEELEAEIRELKEAKAALEEDLEDARYEARQESEKMLAAHQEEIARLKRQIEDAGQSDDRDALIEELKEQKAALEDDLEDTRYEARQEVEKLSAEHEKEIADLQRQIEDAGQSEQLEAQLEELREQKTDLEGELEDLRRQMAREIEDIEAQHEREVQKLQRQIKEASSAPQLEARVQELEYEKKAQEEEFSAQIQDIKKQKASFEDDLKFKLQRVEDQKFSIEEELKGRIQVLEEEKLALEEDFEDAHRQVEEINAEHEREVNGLKRQIVGNESTIRDLQLQVQDLEDQKFTLEADLKEARLHADELVSKHDRELAQLKRQLADGSNSSQEVQKQLQSLETEKTTLRDELKEARRMAEEASSQHDRAIQDLKRQIKTAGSSSEDHLRDLEVQKMSLEDELKQAHQQAERAASQHERALRDLKRRLDNAGSTSEQVKKLEEEKLDLMEELENARRQSEKTTSQHERAMRDLQRRLDIKSKSTSSNEEIQELEDQKLALERDLEDACRQADKAASQHERAIRDLKRQLERKPSDTSSSDEVQRLEDEKVALEEALEDAREDARKAASQHERAMRDIKRRLEMKSTPAYPSDQVQELEDGKLALEDALDEARRQAEQTALQHQRAIRDLKRQIDQAGSSNDQIHDLEDQKVILEEILEEARQQAESTAAQHKQAVADLKRQIQDAAASQSQLHDLEDEKIVLEEALEEVEEARQRAEENAAQHERALRAMKRKLEKAERDLKTTQPSHKSERHLLRSQAEIENLEHDIRQQQETIDALAASEGSLRRKLERARSERAAYRMSAEKLQRELSRAQKTPSPAKQRHDTYGSDEAITTVVRAAESAEERHKKEIRGMITQMEWMQKRWEREASLRSDAAYAKRYLQLQLNVANAWYVPLLRSFNPLNNTLMTSSQQQSAATRARGDPHPDTRLPQVPHTLTEHPAEAEGRAGELGQADAEDIPLHGEVRGTDEDLGQGMAEAGEDQGEACCCNGREEENEYQGQAGGREG